MPFTEMFVLMNSSQREGQVEAGVMMSTHTGKDTEEETKGAGVSSLLFSETQNIPDCHSFQADRLSSHSHANPAVPRSTSHTVSLSRSQLLF